MHALRAVLLSLLLAACNGEAAPSVYVGRGVVREVQPEYRQLVIAHEDIPGLMPAMTMNFDVADPALLEAARPGQSVRFELEYTGKSYRIVALEPLVGVAVGGAAPGGASLATALALETAPPFALVDQDGARLALADLRGKAVLLDFVYTRCPGPCPILTGILVDVQRSLAPEVRARTRFVSITLDPAHDTPEVLRAWAARRGLDTRDWSLLTGSLADVDAVLERYGIGAVRSADGEIDHLVAIFLIDPQGGVAERYLGTELDPARIAADVARAVEAGATAP